MSYVNAAAMTPRARSTAATRFEPARLAAKKPGIGSAIVQYILDHPYAVYAFFRRFKPVLVAKGWAFISRYDDVVDVLKRQDVFAVPFGAKIETLNDGPNFLLGPSAPTKPARSMANSTSKFCNAMSCIS